jgi:hypothetical protein
LNLVLRPGAPAPVRAASVGSRRKSGRRRRPASPRDPHRSPNHEQRLPAGAAFRVQKRPAQASGLLSKSANRSLPSVRRRVAVGAAQTRATGEAESAARHWLLRAALRAAEVEVAGADHTPRLLDRWGAEAAQAGAVEGEALQHPAVSEGEEAAAAAAAIPRPHLAVSEGEAAAAAAAIPRPHPVVLGAAEDPAALGVVGAAAVDLLRVTAGEGTRAAR